MAHSLQLCTWNIHLGLQLDTILKLVRTDPNFADLDLLALQEASIHADEEDACRIAWALGRNYLSYQTTAHFLGKYPQANALVWNASRFQVKSKDTVLLPRVRDVELSRAERTILCALPQQQRISIMLEGLVGDEFCRVYVAHLDVLGIAHKREQFHRVLADARSRQPVPDLTILAGDLNTFRFRSRPSWSALASAAQKDGFQDLTTEIPWTHHTLRSVHFRQKLDAIFVHSQGKFHYRSWSVDLPGSDHIPVFAELTIE